MNKSYVNSHLIFPNAPKRCAMPSVGLGEGYGFRARARDAPVLQHTRKNYGFMLDRNGAQCYNISI